MRVIIVHLGSSPGACSSWKLWPGLFWAKHCLNSSALLTLSDPPGAQSLQALDHSGLSAILTSYLVLLASLKTPHCTIISTSRNHPSQTVIFWVPVIQRNKKSGSSQSLSWTHLSPVITAVGIWLLIYLPLYLYPTVSWGNKSPDFPLLAFICTLYITC
jgi:hypothetical protein